MKLKASVDYGARAIVYLAVNGGTCSSREISEKMSVPRDYLIHLALRLRNAGLIKARPGKNGGYVLAKKPEDISIAQIMNAFDSDLKHSRQDLKRIKRASDQSAAILQVHSAIMNSLDCFLDSVSIQDLIDASAAGTDVDMLMADAFEKEAARLRAKSK